MVSTHKGSTVDLRTLEKCDNGAVLGDVHLVQTCANYKASVFRTSEDCEGSKH